MVELLLKQEGILLNAADNDGVTALFVASQVNIKLNLFLMFETKNLMGSIANMSYIMCKAFAFPNTKMYHLYFRILYSY